MTKQRHVAVIDIGKTNVKLALVGLDDLSEIAVSTQPNTVCPGPPWPHYDVANHWIFLLAELRKFHATYGVDAISITTHGASIVLLDASGQLAAPILDYEYDGPEQTKVEYDALRPPFSETGSPRLAGGLNVGAQLFWQFKTDPDLLAGVEHVVTYPQYWGHGLTGVVATDVTSLGCHTDLWVPQKAQFSSLVQRLGLAGKISSPLASHEVLGTLLPKVAKQTGLPVETPVFCGIHDSNASLLPHLMNQTVPFSVVSTGTWVIAMSVGGVQVELDPTRDTLINVSALGDPVQSARFMGGREFDLALEGQQVVPAQDEIATILADSTMLMPAVATESGPFKGRKAYWVGSEPKVGSGARSVAIALYLALMTKTCLELIGHKGKIIVEGPFAANSAYLDMLSVATHAPVCPSLEATGTSQGAALLAMEKTQFTRDEMSQHEVRAELSDVLHDYSVRWLAEVNASRSR